MNRCNAVRSTGSQQTFRRRISLPSSGFESYPSKKLTRSRQQAQQLRSLNRLLKHMSPLSVDTDQISKTTEQQHPLAFTVKCLRVQDFKTRRSKDEILKGGEYWVVDELKSRMSAQLTPWNRNSARQQSRECCFGKVTGRSCALIQSHKGTHRLTGEVPGAFNLGAKWVYMSIWREDTSYSSVVCVRYEDGYSYEHQEKITVIYSNGRYGWVDISVCIIPDVHCLPLESSGTERVTVSTAQQNSMHTRKSKKK
jgi:hypothetical protein